MIDAECPWCHDQGPHVVTQDNDDNLEAVCEDCGCAMHVVLYDVKEPTEQAKDS